MKKKRVKEEEQIRPTAARKKFLDAARKEFAAKGYAGSSIRTITRSLGMRESAFYAHFASKQEAYDEVFREGGPDVILALATALDPSRPPLDQLLCLSDAAMKEWTSSDGKISTSLLLREAFGQDDSKRQQLLNGVGKAVHALNGKFTSWQKNRFIRTDISGDILGFQFVAPMITARLLFFNPGTSQADQKRGFAMVRSHVKAFCTSVQSESHTAS